jgi:hypothetical protein
MTYHSSKLVMTNTLKADDMPPRAVFALQLPQALVHGLPLLASLAALIDMPDINSDRSSISINDKR